MIAYQRSKIHRRKPRHAQLNTGHPLAHGLIGCWFFNEGAGDTANSKINRNDKLIVNDPTVIWSPYGSGVGAGTLDNGIFGLNPSGAGGVGAQIATPSSLLQPSKAVSVFWKGVRNQNPSGSNHPAYVSMYVTNGAGSIVSPFLSYGMNVRSDSATSVYYFDALGGANSNLNGGVMANNVPFDIGQTIDGSSGNVFAYMNGRQVATANRGAGTTISYASPVLRVGYNFIPENSHGISDIILIWNRPLSATEMLWLHDDPYAVIAWPRRKWFIFSAPAITINITGDQIVLTDAVTTNLASGPPGIVLNLSDTIVLSDSMVDWVGIVQSFTDSLVFSDFIQTYATIVIGLFDSISLSDSLGNLNAAIGVLAKDVLNLSDNITKSAQLFMSFNDTMTFTDILQLLVNAGQISLSDAISLTDAINTQLASVFQDVARVLSDSISLQDGVNMQANLYIMSLTDMIHLEDSVQVLLGSSFSSYIRRYLNDVV